MKWDQIFLDADEALFTFDSLIGLQRVFLDYSITFTAEDFQDYQAANKSLWVDYQNGAITSLRLQHERFESWAERLNVEPGKLNEAFINTITEICTSLLGAVSLPSTTHGNVKVGTTTNGSSALQQICLGRTGLRDYSDLLVVPKEVGVVESNKKIFDYALEQAGSSGRSHMLMAGNAVESDILGDINVGLATCRLNAHNREQPEGVVPTWTVPLLHELEQFLYKH